MNPLKIISFAIATLIFSVPVMAQDSADKIGTVNMQKLVQDYYKSELIRTQFKFYGQEVNDENTVRIEKIKALVEEARDFQKQGDNSSLQAEAKEVLFKKAGVKNQQAQSLANARIAWIKRKQAAIGEKAAVEFRNLRAEIIEIVQQVAEEQGYDFIFDGSGSSGAQVTILSFSKDATDMTANLLQVLNKDAPEKSEGDGEGSSTE